MKIIERFFTHKNDITWSIQIDNIHYWYSTYNQDTDKYSNVEFFLSTKLDAEKCLINVYLPGLDAPKYLDLFVYQYEDN